MFELMGEAKFQEVAGLVCGVIFVFTILSFLIQKRNPNLKGGFASMLSWLIIAPFIFIFASLQWPYPLVALCMASIYGAKNFFQMTGMYHRSNFVWACYLGIVFSTYCMLNGLHSLFNSMPVLILFVSCLIPLLRNSYKRMTQYIALTLMNFCFIWAFLHLGWIRMMEQGVYTVLFIILLTEFRSLAGTVYDSPHEFVIAIPKRQKADVGDIVLTWWQTGSGMQRAIVVGGSSTEPIVRYLDIAYDNPSGAGKREDTLKPDSFVLLTEKFQIGTSVSVKVNGQQRVGQLLAANAEQLLVQEFAGKVKLYPRRDATPLPIRPELNDGQAARAQLFGTLKPITVTKVDERIGRVFATYQLGRTEKEKVFSFGEVVAESL